MIKFYINVIMNIKQMSKIKSILKISQESSDKKLFGLEQDIENKLKVKYLNLYIAFKINITMIILS